MWRYGIRGAFEDGRNNHSGNKNIKERKGFEGTDEVNVFQKRLGRARGHDWKLYKQQVRLDSGKFSFGNRVCDECNRLPTWVGNEESLNKFKGNLDQYLRDNRGFK